MQAAGRLLARVVRRSATVGSELARRRHIHDPDQSVGGLAGLLRPDEVIDGAKGVRRIQLETIREMLGQRPLDLLDIDGYRGHASPSGYI